MFELLFLFFCLTVLEVILEIDNVTALKERLKTLPDNGLSRGHTPHFLTLGMRLALAYALFSFVSQIGNSLGLQAGAEHSHQSFRMLGGFTIILFGMVLMLGNIFCFPSVGAKSKNTGRYRRNGNSGTLVGFLMLDALLSLDSVIATVAMTSSFALAMAAMCTAAMVVAICHEALGEWLRTNPRMVTYAYLLITLLGVNLLLNAAGVHIPKTILLPLAGLCFWLNSLEKLLLSEVPRKVKRERGCKSSPIGARFRSRECGVERVKRGPEVYCVGTSPSASSSGAVHTSERVYNFGVEYHFSD